MPDRLVISALVMFLAICGGITVAGGAQKGGRSAAPGDAAEPIEIEDVQEVDEAEADTSPGKAELLGRMHPALVHFPIAWVFLLVILETGALTRGRDELSLARLPLLVLACLSFVPAAATGFLRSAAMGNDPEIRALLVPHRNLNIAASLACLVALAIRIRAGEYLRANARWMYLLLVAGAGLLLVLAGHLGGKMVFGPRYLPF
jgi:uncharacterized membrane protein